MENSSKIPNLIKIKKVIIAKNIHPQAVSDSNVLIVETCFFSFQITCFPVFYPLFVF